MGPNRFWRPQTDFATLAGVLKLSVKYDMSGLRRDAISHLSDCYPTTLAAWDNRPERQNPFPPFEALRLARSMDIPQVLPSLFLDCVNVPMDVLLVIAKTAGSSESDLLTSDLLIYVQGWQRLLEATFTRIFAFSKGRPMGAPRGRIAASPNTNG
jgi:hypothetical protein